MQGEIEVPDGLYAKFSEKAPLFIVQAILNRNISEEMKIYKKNLIEK